VLQVEKVHDVLKAQGLRLQAGLPSVQHEDRIDGRRVDRGWNAAVDIDMFGVRIGGESHVRRQRDAHENGRVGSNSGRAVALFVASVSDEKRVLWVAS
jgi:hypothetical protein